LLIAVLLGWSIAGSPIAGSPIAGSPIGLRRPGFVDRLGTPH
jgi:hypothetical protein